jgi:ATP-dependent RNA helicase DeaD
MPRRILSLAKRYMQKNYEHIIIEKKQLTTNLTDQIYFEVNANDRFEALCRIIDIENEFYGLVFCRTKVDVDDVSSKLNDRGYDAEALHGDITQYSREKILNKFKLKKLNVLVATDVAARGIDINNLSHVINYSLPQNPESYVHRIGRTGRAGKKGIAVTFVTPAEYRKLIVIKKIANTDIRKEKIPKIKDVITSKKMRIFTDISNIIESGSFTDFEGMAQEMLANCEPHEVVSAMLKYSFQDELDAKNYNEIRNVSIDTKGKARLFVALGREHDMTPRKLIDYILDKVDIPAYKIKQVRIFDSFSFISVPFVEAEYILEIFKGEKKRGRRPLIERAKEKKRS